MRNISWKNESIIFFLKKNSGFLLKIIKQKQFLKEHFRKNLLISRLSIGAPICTFNQFYKKKKIIWLTNDILDLIAINSACLFDLD